MENVRSIFLDWNTGGIVRSDSGAYLARQYDHLSNLIVFRNAPELENYYLIVEMKEGEDDLAARSMEPIMLPGPYWLVPNVYTQLVQPVTFQVCCKTESGDFEQHSAKFKLNVIESLRHDGADLDVDPSPMFDAYEDYVDEKVQELIDEAGGISIDTRAYVDQKITEMVAAAGEVIIDSTLSISGAAADAKATGDAISETNGRLNNVMADLNYSVKGLSSGILLNHRTDYSLSYGFIGADGMINTGHGNGQKHTSLIPVDPSDGYIIKTTYKSSVVPWVAVATYDSNETFLERTNLVSGGEVTETETSYTVPENVHYVRFMFSSFDIGSLSVCEKSISEMQTEINAISGQFVNYTLNKNYKKKSGVNAVTIVDDITSCISEKIPVTWSGVVRFDAGIVGDKYVLAIYDNNDELISWLGLSGSSTLQTRNVDFNNYPAASYILFSFNKEHGGKITSTDGSTILWESDTVDIRNVSNTVDKLSNTVDDVIFDIQIAHNAENTFPSDLFINAGLRNGKITGDKYRVASDNIFEFPYPVAIAIASGYRIGVHSFDSDGDFVSDSGWKTSNYSLPLYTPFKIVISKVTEDSSTTADIEEFVNAITVLPAKTNKTNVYYGDAIVLNNDNQTVHGVDITLWKDFLGSEIENLSDYALHLNQSMTIFGGYVFLFSTNGLCTILDYDTKEIVGTCNFEPATIQHANSAQFTDVYYDANDEFPLMLLSRCGNSSSGSGNDECLIYRINRSGTTFTMTLVNTIEPNFATYGASWGIDTNTNMLYMSTTVNGTWQVTENNPIMFSAFEFPAKSKILSGSPITIEESDIIAKMYIPHYTLQGMAVNGGVIYTGISYNGHNVWAVDILKNRILSKIHLTSSYEVEGVSVYDGKIYVSQKSGTDTTAVNPCKIYELSF